MTFKVVEKLTRTRKNQLELALDKNKMNCYFVLKIYFKYQKITYLLSYLSALISDYCEKYINANNVKCGSLASSWLVSIRKKPIFPH